MKWASQRGLLLVVEHVHEALKHHGELFSFYWALRHKVAGAGALHDAVVLCPVEGLFGVRIRRLLLKVGEILIHEGLEDLVVHVVLLVNDVWELAPAGPGPGLVAGFGSYVAAGRDLDAVFPARRGFDDEAFSGIDADVAGSPDQASGHDAGEVAGRAAYGDHAGLVQIREAVDLIAGPAVDLGLITGPAPDDALNEPAAVEAEGVRARRSDLRRPGGLLVIRIGQSPDLVLLHHRPAPCSIDV